MTNLQKKTFPPSLDSVNVDMIRKYFRKVREYHRAYRDNIKEGKDMEKTLKLYKSHCRVPTSEHN